LDTPALDLRNPLLRLGGSIFMLVEFPFLSIPPRSVEALFNLKIQGFIPIVAHPERYADVQIESAPIQEWQRIGAYFQANAGSFVGSYGRAAEKTVWKLLEAGLISYVCSDFHAVGECHVQSAFEAIERRYGLSVATLLFSSNPSGIPLNEAPAPAVIAKKKGFFGRFGLPGRA
jgi:protein-tyrosine phosphatase